MGRFEGIATNLVEVIGETVRATYDMRLTCRTLRGPVAIFEPYWRLLADGSPLSFGVK